ncbi:MAG: ATP-binding protein [Acidobacteriota bacterium]
MNAAPPPDGICLVFRSSPRMLCVVRAAVRQFLAQASFDEGLTERVTLAIDESCTNVIRHGYQGCEDGLMELTLGIAERSGRSRQLEIRLADEACKAPSEAMKAPAPSAPTTPGGLGLHFIHEVMDEVCFDENVERGNVLILRLGCPEAAEPNDGARASSGSDQGPGGSSC